MFGARFLFWRAWPWLEYDLKSLFEYPMYVQHTLIKHSMRRCQQKGRIVFGQVGSS